MPRGKSRTIDKTTQEKGSPYKDGAFKTVLIYPASYSVGMASLGFLSVFKTINRFGGYSCERAFYSAGEIRSVESQKPLRNFPVIAVSIAWELELENLIRMLISSGIPPMRKLRSHDFPLVIAGGPLTTVAPSLLAPIADIIFLGESENSLVSFLELADKLSRDELLEQASHINGVWVPMWGPEREPEREPERDLALHDTPGNADIVSIEKLPAFSFFTTPRAQFGEKVLIEIERGCSRGCDFCVMSRKAAPAGMRVVPVEKLINILTPVPPSTGLVGAAVTDHPNLKTLMKHLIDGGGEVSLSSLRADRLDEELMELLKLGGMKTLTIASDASSQTLRERISKGISEADLLKSAALARKFKIPKIKLYEIIGYPGESEQDINELAKLSLELAKYARLTITLSPLVPKPGTPLEFSPFPTEKEVKNLMKMLKRAVKGKVEIKAVSWRDAAIEYYLDKTKEQGCELFYESIINNKPRGPFIKKLSNL